MLRPSDKIVNSPLQTPSRSHRPHRTPSTRPRPAAHHTASPKGCKIGTTRLITGPPRQQRRRQHPIDMTAAAREMAAAAVQRRRVGLDRARRRRGSSVGACTTPPPQSSQRHVVPPQADRRRAPAQWHPIQQAAAPDPYKPRNTLSLSRSRFSRRCPRTNRQTVTI